MNVSTNDAVTILCYGQLIRMKRKDAINSFTKKLVACNGCERERYNSIITGLKQGFWGVDDTWNWFTQGV